METQQERILYLLQRYAERSATAAERGELTALLASAQAEDIPEEFVTQLLENYKEEEKGAEPAWDDIYARILAGRDAALPEVTRVHFIHSAWFRYAAAVIVAIGLIGFFYINNTKKNAGATQTASEIKPGRSGAVLTLADGSQVVLDSLKNGVVADQNGSTAVLRGGQLAYDPAGSTTGSTAYNKVTTPKGRQFEITLPDGTKVWLNAASSIRYPTAFAGKERMVEINGEAYLEVAKDAGKPFRVNVPGRAKIDVLGTSFNVSAYDNDRVVNATLLEGSIKVNGVKIDPGQQALVAGNADADNTLTGPEVSKADVNKAVAWKNGLFNFEGATLEEVMKQLERWYDIDVVYAAGIPNIAFGGEMTKNISLQGLLIVLEKSDVHFKLDGRKLIVLP